MKQRSAKLTNSSKTYSERKKKEKTQVINIRNEMNITTDPSDIKRIVRECYEKLYRQKLDNLETMEQIPQKAEPTTAHTILNE